MDGADIDRLAGLFADLSAQWEAAEAGELAAEVAERTRYERGQVDLADRCRAARGAPLEVSLTTGDRLRGALTASGIDWLLLANPLSACLIAYRAIAGVKGLPPRSAPAEIDGAVGAKWTFRLALGVLCRERLAVRLTRCDGVVIGGTLDRVGADHVDLAEHPEDQPRRSREVRAAHVVPLAAICLVTYRPTDPAC